MGSPALSETKAGRRQPQENYRKPFGNVLGVKSDIETFLILLCLRHPAYPASGGTLSRATRFQPARHRRVNLPTFLGGSDELNGRSDGEVEFIGVAV